MNFIKLFGSLNLFSLILWLDRVKKGCMHLLKVGLIMCVFLCHHSMFTYLHVVLNVCMQHHLVLVRKQMTGQDPSSPISQP